MRCDLNHTYNAMKINKIIPRYWRSPRSLTRPLSTQCFTESVLRPVLYLPTIWDKLPTAYIRHHLFLLGYEKIRFYAYQELSPLTAQRGGGFIKKIIGDFSLFVKREWAKESESLARICRSVPIFDDAKTLDLKLFFISVGGMMLTGEEENVRLLTNELLELFMKQFAHHISLDSSISEEERRVLKIASTHYQTCKINYRKLYDPKIGPRSFMVNGLTFSIELPSLPQISSKQLLARALLHKELHRALMLPGHNVHRDLKRSQLSLGPATGTVLRYDLLFLDGLGDLLIASESCHILHEFRLLNPYSCDSSFGKKTFTMLKNILSTNSLLLRLAMSYNMHIALEDPIVSALLRESYLPKTFSEKFVNDMSTYEEEFLADFFEQYVGALFLDLPYAAKQWLNELFERILTLISDSYRIDYRRKNNFRFDYRAWSVDVIGRSI